MQLTTREAKLVERLRKQERQWPRLRWFALGVGVFSAICASFIVILLFQHLDSILAVHDDFMSRLWLLAFARFWPMSLILFGSSAFFIFWCIRDWHGNTNRVLLLKLLDGQQKDEVV
jgi:hypothetical protein